MNGRRTVFLRYAHSDQEFAHSLVVALTGKLPPSIQFVLDADIVSPGENLFVGIANALAKSLTEIFSVKTNHK